jgi:hypothetical protein
VFIILLPQKTAELQSFDAPADVARQAGDALPVPPDLPDIPLRAEHSAARVRTPVVSLGPPTGATA